MKILLLHRRKNKKRQRPKRQSPTKEECGIAHCPGGKQGSRAEGIDLNPADRHQGERIYPNHGATDKGFTMIATITCNCEGQSPQLRAKKAEPRGQRLAAKGQSPLPEGQGSEARAQIREQRLGAIAQSPEPRGQVVARGQWPVARA